MNTFIVPHAISFVTGILKNRKIWNFLSNLQRIHRFFRAQRRFCLICRNKTLCLIKCSRPLIFLKSPQHDFGISRFLNITQHTIHHKPAIALAPIVRKTMYANKLRLPPQIPDHARHPNTQCNAACRQLPKYSHYLFGNQATACTSQWL